MYSSNETNPYFLNGGVRSDFGHVNTAANTRTPMIGQPHHQISADFARPFAAPTMPWAGYSNYTSLLTTDLYETEKQYLLCIDVPGCNPERINIVVERGCLVLSGVSAPSDLRKKVTDEQASCLIQERACSAWSRRYDLPFVNTESTVLATYKDGTLELEVNKDFGADDKRVKIQKR